MSTFAMVMTVFSQQKYLMFCSSMVGKYDVNKAMELLSDNEFGFSEVKKREKMLTVKGEKFV